MVQFKTDPVLLEILSRLVDAVQERSQAVVNAKLVQLIIMLWVILTLSCYTYTRPIKHHQDPILVEKRFQAAGKARRSPCTQSYLHWNPAKRGAYPEPLGGEGKSGRDQFPTALDTARLEVLHINYPDDVCWIMDPRAAPGSMRRASPFNEVLSTLVAFFFRGSLAPSIDSE
jgi:hypothetical protein